VLLTCSRDLTCDWDGCYHPSYVLQPECDDQQTGTQVVRLTAGRPVCTLCTPCWQASLHNLQTLLVDQSAHSAHPAGRPVCTICTPCWWTSMYSLQTSLADRSALSADLTGRPVCTVCRPHRQTSLHCLQTSLADQSAQSADLTGRPVCTVCTPHWWTSLQTSLADLTGGPHWRTSLQTSLADQSAQSAQSAGGTVCQLPSLLISICSYCISYWMLYSLKLVFSKCDKNRCSPWTPAN
jgi:hypothetical protein